MPFATPSSGAFIYQLELGGEERDQPWSLAIKAKQHWETTVRSCVADATQVWKCFGIMDVFGPQDRGGVYGKSLWILCFGEQAIKWNARRERNEGGDGSSAYPPLLGCPEEVSYARHPPGVLPCLHLHRPINTPALAAFFMFCTFFSDIHRYLTTLWSFVVL